MKRAVFLIIAIISLFLSCANVNMHKEITVVDGVLDLSGTNLEENWIVPLKGNWAFYWNRFADSGNIRSFVPGSSESYIDVPRFWNAGEEPYPSFGNAVYALTIYSESSDGLLGLKMVNLNPNFTLYANGQRVYSCGDPNPYPQFSQPGNVSLVLPLVPRDGRIDLVIAISNWHTNKPGLFRLPTLGNYETVMEELMKEKILESLFIGGMLLLTLYLLFSFIYNTEDKRPLWLSLVILSAALYTSVKGPLVLMDLFPGSGGEARSKIIYLVLLCYPYFTYMQYSRQPNLKISRLIGRIDSSAVIGLSLFLFLEPKSVFTRFELLFVVHALMISLYVVFVLVRDLVENRTLESLLSLIGDMLLLLAVVYSMVENSVPIAFSGQAVYFFFFCSFQTLLQARFASKNRLMVQVLSERNKTLRDQKDQYENQALMDHLTRVKNRRSLDSFLKKSWDMGSFLEQGIGIIMVDIDYFKKYNDSLGHKEGDVCLVKVAEALSGSLKRNQDFIARYGGEEFIVIIQGVDSLLNLIAIGEHLRQAVEDLQIIHPDSDCSPYVTISVGAEYQIPGRESDNGSDELIRRADTALYLAKNRGRNRVETVSPLPLEDPEDETDLVTS